MLKVDVVILSLSFSDDGTFLQTDRGLLHIAPVSPIVVFSPTNVTCSILVKDQWVARGMENVLWLPSDYRPTCTAVCGTVAALGHGSGRLSILEFAAYLIAQMWQAHVDKMLISNIMALKINMLFLGDCGE